MTQREVITEAMLQAAVAALDKRIAMPPLSAEKRYSRREAFARLRGKAKEALAAGHTLETVLDDLKGVGLGMEMCIRDSHYALVRITTHCPINTGV